MAIIYNLHLAGGRQGHAHPSAKTATTGEICCITSCCANACTWQVVGKAVPIKYGSGGSVLAVLVNDVVTLPAPSSSSSSSVRFMQQLGMATQMQQPNASSDDSQPWDGIIVSGMQPLCCKCRMLTLLLCLLFAGKYQCSFSFCHVQRNTCCSDLICAAIVRPAVCHGLFCLAGYGPASASCRWGAAARAVDAAAGHN
jgi:hypothetical protein